MPPYVQADHLAAGFSDASGGDVSHVVLADRCGVRLQAPAVAAAAEQPSQSPFVAATVGLNQFKSAYIVFRSTKALRTLLADGVHEVPLYRANKTLLDTGLAKWTRQYLAGQPDERTLEAEVTEYMTVFERTEEEQRDAERRQKAEATAVDDEGWQTVGKGRGAGFEQKESTLRRLEDKIEDGKKRKELLNFYTFQIRDSKKQHVVGLRKRFEEDKRKIESMKQSRQFRPY